MLDSVRTRNRVKKTVNDSIDIGLIKSGLKYEYRLQEKMGMPQTTFTRKKRNCSWSINEYGKLGKYLMWPDDLIVKIVKMAGEI